MSLDYELRIITDWQPQQVSELLAKELDLQWGEENRLFNSGTIAAVFSERERTQSMMLEHYGFKPTIDVWFRLKQHEDGDLDKQTLLTASMLLLSKLPGDAVLLFNYERTVLQRIEGTLIFNSQPTTWQEAELAAEVKLPYYIEPLRSPLISDDLPVLEVSNAMYARLQAVAVTRGKSVTELNREAIEAFLQVEMGKEHLARSPATGAPN
jgi:hypothetical protein